MNANIRIERVGREQSPIIILDDALRDPAALIAEAERATWDLTSAYYPGIRAPAPAGYAASVARVAAMALTTAGIPRAAVCIPEEATFSLVTTPPSALLPYQVVPHFDGVAEDLFAVVHYLCAVEGSGTAFYRHRRTGFEAISADRLELYRAQTDAEWQTGTVPKGYIDRSTDQYERIASVPCAFNRMLIYPGRILHSGVIPPGFAFSAVPAEGRLTANLFLRCR